MVLTNKEMKIKKKQIEAEVINTKISEQEATVLQAKQQCINGQHQLDKLKEILNFAQQHLILLKNEFGSQLTNQEFEDGTGKGNFEDSKEKAINQ